MTETEVVAYLAAAGLGLTTAAPAPTIYDQPLPAGAPARAVSVVVVDGAPSDRTFGPSLKAPLGVHPIFQVMTRDEAGNELEAKALAHAICVKLDGLGPIVLSGVLYRDIRCLDGEPKFLSYDGQGRPRYYCKFEVDKDRSA